MALRPLPCQRALLISGAVLLGTLACAAGPPEWFHPGKALAIDPASMTVVSGQGGIEGQPNPHLACAAAENRARSQLSRRLSPYLQAVSAALKEGQPEAETLRLGLARARQAVAGIAGMAARSRRDERPGSCWVEVTTTVREPPRDLARRLLEQVRQERARVE